jgi:putative glutamine amidotransferase
MNSSTSQGILVKQTGLILFLLLIPGFCFSQDFFRKNVNTSNRYIILANPTVHNIQTIQFLLTQNILDIPVKKIKFVGVYHADQNYDFSKTLDYFKKNKIEHFYLHEVQGMLQPGNLFTRNAATDDFKTIFTHSIGIFFFGGPDLPPAIYGNENQYAQVTDPVRHYFEASFLFHLVGGYQDETYTPLLDQNPSYLITGFCLGMQTLNVATGGTLTQDIPAQIYGALKPKDILNTEKDNLHRNYWQELVKDTLLMGINFHRIQFTKHPFFGKTIRLNKKQNPRVYSSHHQAIKMKGKNLEITASSMDGKIIEGVAHSEYPNVFGVQFHPEVPALYEDLYKRKFHPEDTPETYNNLIGKKNVRFHKRFWKHISGILRKVEPAH